MEGSILGGHLVYIYLNGALSDIASEVDATLFIEIKDAFNIGNKDVRKKIIDLEKKIKDKQGKRNKKKNKSNSSSASNLH